MVISLDVLYIYAKPPAFGGGRQHFCTFTCTENLHPLLPALCLNHPQSPVFCLMETKLSRQIFFPEENRKIGHRSIQM